MKTLILLFLLVNAVLSLQTYTGISRQSFGAEFLDNLKKEGRVRFGKSMKVSYTDVIEDLFVVYDPSFLAYVWPKLRTGVHLNIGNACWDDFGVFFKDLVQGRSWAYSAVDASGRYVPGLLVGNNYWLGSKEECFQLENSFLQNVGNDTFTEFRNSDYLNHLKSQGSGEEWRYLIEQDELMQNILEAEKVPPFRLTYTTAKISLNVSKPTLMKSYVITIGLCVPRTCTSEDIKHVLDFSVMINDNFRSNKTSSRTIKINTIKRIEENYGVKRDAGAVILIIFTILLVILVVTATIVDLELFKFRHIHPKSMSFDLERPPTDNRLTLEALEANNLELLDKTYKNNESKLLPKTHCCSKKNQTNKHSNIVDMETLTINNMNNSNNINLVTVKKVMKPNTKPPSITLDVVAVDEPKKGCRRCGKYKKQFVTSKETDNLTDGPRISKYNTYEGVTVNQNEDKCKKDSLLRSLLLCFSLNYSMSRIFNTNMANRDLLAVHVMKVIATFWMIFVHVCLIISSISANDTAVSEDSSIFTIFGMGSFAFDTLFYISGVLSAHHFFYLKSQYTTEELVSFGGAFGQILQVICFVTNRAIRLLPSYMYVLFLGAYFARKHRWTSALEIPEQDYENCDRFWWRNLLYINTFYDREDRCMQWSWYLSADTQLHLVGVVWLSLLRRWRIALLLVSTFLGATVTADVVSHINHYRDSLTNTYAVYDAFIERAWSRPAPYFVGLFTGWLVQRLEGQMKVTRVTSSCLWTASIVVLISSFVHPWSARSLGATADIILSSLSHSFWALALAWPAVVFATQCANWSRRMLCRSGVVALSRLSYGVLLVHGVVLRVLLFCTDTPLSMDTCTLLSYFVCTSVLSVMAAFLLSLLVETPCCSLLRRLTDCTNS